MLSEFWIILYSIVIFLYIIVSFIVRFEEQFMSKLQDLENIMAIHDGAREVNAYKMLLQKNKDYLQVIKQLSRENSLSLKQRSKRSRLV
jgi:hypothetical protein